MAFVVVKFTHIQPLLHELNITEAHIPVLFTNNINEKFLAANPMMYGKMKHIKIDFYFIYDLVMKNKMDVQYTPTRDQV